MSVQNKERHDSLVDALTEQLNNAKQLADDYMEILDILPDIIYKLDPDGNFLYLSNAVSMLGYSPEELLGRHFSTIIHSEDLPNVSREQVLPRFTGKVTGPKGAPKLFDERRTGERMTKDLVVRLIPKNVPEDKSDSHKQIFPGEVYSTGQYNKKTSAPWGGLESEQYSEKKSKAHPRQKEEFYAVIANYGEYDNGPSVSERKFIGTVGSIRDIRDRIKLEKKQAELDEQRLHSKKMEAIGVLAGGIAHDFNNLLQGLFGYISMARLSMDSRDKCSEMLEQAENALHMSVNLTKQLLTFSKGGRPVKKQIFIPPVIENITRLTLSGSHNDYRMESDNDLWAVEADEGQISQVIQNIIMNADQAMPVGGTIFVSADNVKAPGLDMPANLAKGHYVRISVKDSGIGIPDHFMQRIFDPYFTTKEKGSGLGLATSYSIIDNHGGTIDVKSKMGEGSVFNIYLPAIILEKPLTHAVAEEETAVRKGKILLMDDEEVVRSVAGEMLEALGHTVHLAVKGEEALKAYLEAMSSGAEFDVVILDLTIRGGMGGKDTMKKLLEINPRVKAIVSSGYTDSSLMADFKKSGFSACLPKPYKVNELKAAVEGLLSQS